MVANPFRCNSTRLSNNNAVTFEPASENGGQVTDDMEMLQVTSKPDT